MSLNVPPFQNAPFLDLANPQHIAAMDKALVEAQREFGKEYPLIIHGEKVQTGQKMRSVNPANPHDVVGIVQRASVNHADQALASAAQAFECWRWERPRTRAQFLLKAAEVMRRRRCEINAFLILEAGKNWAEADADTAEAIDFCEFYAREALRYAEPQPVGELPGEKTSLMYLPLGVCVVIPPWNFPFAILTGMTVAAWVAGNTVVLKPASDTPVLGAKFMEIMEEIGLPPGVVNFLTGPGNEIGSRLVADPRVQMIAFTGSRDVGLQVVEQAGKQRAGQRAIKRVIAEMGGKNATIVDDEADLDAAADGVALAAFGYQGQKCSAGSRAIVVNEVYDAFVAKLKAHTAQLTMGAPKDRKNFLGPVMNEKQLAAIQKYIELGKTEGELLCGGHRVECDGFFLEPTIFIDVDPKARIAQEEIFGPVLAVIRANNFDDALQIANSTDYGLTGAVYSRNHDKLALARERFHVGNLYLNRKCTGAMVAGHPFGGFNMSGTNAKAGGRDYLKLFLQAKSVAEKI